MGSPTASAEFSSDLYDASDFEGSLEEKTARHTSHPGDGNGMRSREPSRPCASPPSLQGGEAETIITVKPSLGTLATGKSSLRQGKRKPDRGVQDEETLVESLGEPTAKGPLLSFREPRPVQTEPDPKRLRLDSIFAECPQFPVSVGRQGLVPTEHGLPIPIWQKIFCFVPPVFLGRLLRVSRKFKTILTPSATSQTLHDTQCHMIAEEIWIASRGRFASGLPRSLQGQTELDMWRLLRGDSCQLCGERKVLLTAGSTLDPWQPASRTDSVRVVWPFSVRCCAGCLKTHSEQEVSLLFSSTFPSCLLTALPCAFVAQSYHYIPSAVMRSAIPPSHVQITKIYFRPHVEQIKRQFESAKEQGSEFAERWIKGLEKEGQQKSLDVHKWEQWEIKGGLRKVNSRHVLKTASTSKLAFVAQPAKVQLSDEHSLQSSSKAGPFPPTVSVVTAVSPSSAGHAALSPHPPKSLLNGGLPKRPLTQSSCSRPEHKIRDINGAKAARRAEIESRCLELDPPLTSDILCHMETFQAALQISTPLTENAWDVLKPRLLGQLKLAEERESERLEQNRAFQKKVEERRQQDAQSKGAKEVLDREWEAFQAPIRERLGNYAEEIIRDQWSSGEGVTKETCIQFAADVLLHVCQRFHEGSQQVVNPPANTNRTLRPSSPTENHSKELILENMKWVFDNKVKMLTERFQKELFLCNGCESNYKFYGFEAVIQHYAAKHTNLLSHGSVVVHWRAKWPEPPPFHPNPTAAKASLYAIPTPISGSAPSQINLAYQPPNASAGVSYHYEPNLRLGSYGPLMGHNINTPFPLWHDYSIPAAQPVISPGPHHLLKNECSFQPGLTGLTDSQQRILNEYEDHKPLLSMTRYAPGGFPVPTPLDLPTAQPTNNGPTLYPGHQLNPSHLHLYETQMNDMAKHARDVWFGTSGIKDIPQSVRIYVVIHQVVSRFESRYTNEPSLAMFRDGLDHNALMRPVRSLNGLACKSCVASAHRANVSSNLYKQYPTHDRKLYTLPLLLNHFKTIHLERIATTIDLQTGMEAARLDWKRDMIELPDTPLISGLMNAAGMDDSKLRLIAAVFPGVFPEPLPLLSSIRAMGPTPKYETSYENTTQHLRGSRPGFSFVSSEKISYTNSNPPTLPQSSPENASESSMRNSEPPGEDEYDPHRPAYLGRLVKSYQTTHPLRKSSGGRSTGVRSHLTGLRQTEHPGQALSDVYRRNVKNIAEGFSGNQILRHQKHIERPRTGQGSYIINGSRSPVGRPLNTCRSESPKAEVLAAERFLREFKPEIGTDPPFKNRIRTSRKESTPNGSPTHGQGQFEHEVPAILDREILQYIEKPSEHFLIRDTTAESLLVRVEPRDSRLCERVPSGHLEYNDYPSHPQNQYVFVNDGSVVRKINSHNIPDHADNHTLYSRNFDDGYHQEHVELSNEAQSTRSGRSPIISASPEATMHEISRYYPQGPHEGSIAEPVYHLHPSTVYSEQYLQNPSHYAHRSIQGNSRTSSLASGLHERHVQCIPVEPGDHTIKERYFMTQAPSHSRDSERMHGLPLYTHEQAYQGDSHMYHGDTRYSRGEDRRSTTTELIQYRRQT